VSAQSHSGPEKAIQPNEALEMMWPLAMDTWAFMKEPHAEPRLQRHVVRLVRGKG
jgi:hypothetical protein